MDKITAQLIRSSLLYASEEMGIALRNASYSPNIKERMDHSAALFDDQGRLLAQAEHIPVHLGSLPWGLANTLAYCRDNGVELEDGSMVAVNNPYIAGTHLNDVTVVSPVFHGGSIVGFAANKAHHSDVGGGVPGSISIGAKTLFEEGFIINPVHLMLRGEFVHETLSTFSSNSRTPRERLGDLRAQAAANVTGARRMVQVIEKYGLESFREAAEESFRYSETMMKARLASLRNGTFTARDCLEHPSGADITLKVKVVTSNSKISVDYEGTDRQVEYPLNAVFGVTISGVYFVIRTLTGDDIPANHGAFSPIEVTAPEGSLLNPVYPHPVGGGNVETSQRNADLVFRALSKAAPGRCPAASGGSMNNVMMGGREWAFYETIAVGLGAKRGMDGIDGIQCNMTNTMNTPIEEIERTMPIMLTRYEFRENSAGPGEYRGGNGVVRAFRALDESTTFTILSERERHSPWGLSGGGAGAKMRAVLVRDGRERTIPNKGTYSLGRGDEVVLYTAGGGGYGNPRRRSRARLEEDLADGLITRGLAAKQYRYRVKPGPRSRRV
jgi:N-methylhydantoinase B